jgi:hypothetical protein
MSYLVSERETEVMLTLDRMTNEASKMASYLNKIAFPLLWKFGTFPRDAAFNLRYLATCPAESTKRMSKQWLPASKIDLTDL